MASKKEDTGVKPPELSNFIIFNSTLCKKEGQEVENILLYYTKTKVCPNFNKHFAHVNSALFTDGMSPSAVSGLVSCYFTTVYTFISSGVRRCTGPTGGVV